MQAEERPAGLPAALIRQAAKCSVRECDETARGRYAAYVDEGSESYDVMLGLGQRGELKTSSCECGHPQPCRHTAALMLHLAKDKKPKAAKAIPKARTKKVSASESLLEDIDVPELKAWLRSVFPSYKELEVAFIHHFTAKNKFFSAEGAVRLTLDALKTLLGRSRTPDTTQIKKLLELWKELHQPIIARYAAGPADQEAFAPLHAMLDTCMSVHRNYQGTGRVPSYVQRILSGLVPQMATLSQEEAFKAATGFFISNIPDEAEGLRMHYVLFVQSLSEACDPQRKRTLAQRVAVQYSMLQERHGEVSNAAYAQAVLGMVQATALFPSYGSQFRPIRYANAYNLSLIRVLMEAGHTSLAEEYAWAQVRSNRQAEYNEQYMELLKELYTLTGDNNGRALIAAELLPETFDFEDYLLVMDSLPDDAARKAFRDKIFTRARHRAGHVSAAAAFSFHLLAHEENWRKMIDNLFGIPYQTINQYFHSLFTAYSHPLLKALLRHRSYGSWLSAGKEDEEGALRLAEAMVAAYGADVVRAAIAAEHRGIGYYAAGGNLIKYLKRVLGG